MVCVCVLIVEAEHDQQQQQQQQRGAQRRNGQSGRHHERSECDHRSAIRMLTHSIIESVYRLVGQLTGLLTFNSLLFCILCCVHIFLH